MMCATLVAGPCVDKGRAKALAFGDNVGFGAVYEGRVQRHICIAVQRLFLHGLKGFGKGRTTIGIDKVIAPVHRRRHRVVAARGRHAKGDR